MKQRKPSSSGGQRANAPKSIDISASTSPSASSPEPSPPLASSSALKNVLRVPLFRRKPKGTDIEPEVTLYPDTGRARINAPQTPYHELDLSDTFLSALHTGSFEPKKTWFRKRRAFFLIGGLLGIFFGWLFTEGDSLSNLKMDFETLSSSWDLQNLVADFPSFPLNVTEYLAPGRDWLNAKGSNFVVGRDAAERGLKKKHAVIIVPGIISSGLESWSTTPDAAPFFRKRIWASTAMVRAILTSKETWVRAMSLDEFTGLDPPGYKVRAAQGLDAATSFMPGYWIWQKVIENLAVLDYDHDDMHLVSYDWRLAYYNLEVRDQYFSRLKTQIDFNLNISGKKTVLISHSMGSLVVLWFLKWVEAEEHGKGGSTWCEDHISDWINISGTMLGVPKAMSALLSGEMRDTVEINAAGVYLLERFFSRSERAKLFRSWAGATSMMLKGGNAVWGDETGAPDDVENSELSNGKIYYFKPEVESNETDINSATANPNLTLNDATSYILDHVPPSYQAMMHSNYSFGMERDPEVIAANDKDHRKWTNPLEVRLPNAPSMSIYCLYGVGKETERAYFYQNGGYEQDEAPSVVESQCVEPNCVDETPRPPLDMPLSRRVWIDGSVTLPDSHEPKVRSGVVFGDGDGTVSLLSLGAMCVDGWKRDIYNPGRSKVITHEIKHELAGLDPRGPTSADHVDILGNNELNEAILDIVTGNGNNVKDLLLSKITEFARKIRWTE